MKLNQSIVPSIAVAMLAAVFGFAPMTTEAQDDNPPLNLARDGFFYIGGKTTQDQRQDLHGRADVCRIPHPGEADASLSDHLRARRHALGRELDRHLRRPRRLGAVFRAPRLRGLCRRPARPRPLRLCARGLRPAALRQRRERAAALPAAGEIQSLAAGEAAHAMARHRRDRRSGVAPDHRQLPAGDRVPEISRVHPRRRWCSCSTSSGPSIMLVHSQGGPMGWLAAEARPDLVRAIVAVEPNGPPGRTVRFVGAPDWFKDGGVELPYGLTPLPITFSPPVKDAVRAQMGAARTSPMRPTSSPAGSRQSRRGNLPNLQRMPIALITSEASYHAAYDHCIVKFLNQAGVTPTWIKLAELGITRQQPQHDAGEELRRDRGGDPSVAGEDAAGGAVTRISLDRRHCASCRGTSPDLKS